MAVLGKAVSVGTTATLLSSGLGGSGVLTVGDFGITIYNNGAATIFVGGSGVTTATGLPIPAAGSLALYGLGSDDSVYGIVAAATCDVRVLELA